VSPARSGVCTFLPFFALAGRRLPTHRCNAVERGKADQHVLTCISTSLYQAHQAVLATGRDFAARCEAPSGSHRGQDTRNEEACSFSSPKAAAISFTYSTSLRLRTSIAISCGDHGNHRPPAWYAGQIKSIDSFSKSLLVVHLCRRSTIVHAKGR
jgi:hypothetical protein